MRRPIGSMVLLLAWLANFVLPAAQDHPSVLPKVPETAAKKLYDELDQGKKILVIDVRSPKEYARGHLPGAVNIPMERLSRKIAEMKVPKDAAIVTVCEHGGRSSRAVQELRKLGYAACSFCRLDAWKKEGYKIEPGGQNGSNIPKVYRFYCQHNCQTYIETADLEAICDHCECGRPFSECMKGN